MYGVEAYGKAVGTLGRYDVIVLADCLWMPSQHANLLRTIAQALSTGPDSRAIVVAGFHTGRRIVRDFFDLATCLADGGGRGSEDEADSGSTAERETGKKVGKFEN